VYDTYWQVSKPVEAGENSEFFSEGILRMGAFGGLAGVRVKSSNYFATEGEDLNFGVS